jgi:hypothetical protein
MIPNAAKIAVNPAHPSHLIPLSLGIQARAQEITVQMATKTAVQVPWRVMELRAVERVMKAEPPTKTQNWRKEKD